MKNLYLILFLLLSFSIYLSAQTTSFDKDYPQFGNANGYIVEETEGGGYILGGVSELGLLVVKTDSSGEVQFSKTFPRSNEFSDLRTFPVHITEDGGFILTSGVINGSITDLNIIKLDSDGNLIWDKTYPDTVSLMGSDIVETEDGDFICIGSIERHIIKIVKIDPDGNLLWSDILTFNPTARILTGPSIIEMSDGNFLLSSERNLKKITAEGDSLWQIALDFKISVIKQTRFGRVIAAGYQKFAVINLEGLVEYEQNLVFTVDAGDNTLDNGYVFLANNNKITKTDSLGVIEWEKDIIREGNFIISTSDGGYAVTGNYSNAMRLMKTDEFGTAESVFLLNQDNYTSLAIFHDFNIEWYSDGIENVDIEYTIDNGVNWLEIVSNYPADSGHYNWYVPNNPSYNCGLRISSSDDSDIMDILNTTFSIIQKQNNDFISVNEIKMWIGNDGTGSHDPYTDNSGFFWPGGEEAEIASVFADGLVWGGKVDNEIRVNGSTYRGGLKPGKILENGQPDDPDLPQYKIFKIRKNWESLPEGTVKDRLEYDYNNWPGDIGAPYIDVNSDGMYTKGIDTPEFIGDEVLFYVANDADTATSKFPYGSDPIGLEFQTTVWGFDTDDFLKDVVFKKYKIINKSGKQIEDFYISYWMDDDLGWPGDDFVGCDTLLSLAYTWNGDNNDYTTQWESGYYGENPPAVGHLLLQGPQTTQEKFNSEKHENKWLSNSYNLPMTAFMIYVGYSPGYAFEDPNLGEIEGTYKFYFNMQGLLSDGEDVIDPISEDTTVFVLPGDPVQKTGWYEGDGWPGGGLSPGDRRSVLSSGPISFAPQDTQEVVVAIFMSRGSDNVRSVAELKNTAEDIHEFWGNEILVDVEENKSQIPLYYSLSQNYPNPFNPSTTIKYSIPSEVNSERSMVKNVTLVVYDILGREIATLVNGKQKPGNYEVEFNANKYPSGVYFYQLKSGNYMNVKKMMLLK